MALATGGMNWLFSADGMRQLAGDIALRTLHKYLTGQVLAALLLTVAVFAFVVLLLNVLKDVLPLVFGGHVSLWLVLKAIGLLLPFAVVYALPMGFITATLLVFGRFSADQELTAARAGGVSLLSLISPVLLLSLFCCGLSAWFNLDLGPRSRVAFIELKYELLGNLANAQVPEGQFIYDFPGYIFYTDKNRDGDMHGIEIWRLNGATNKGAFIWASQGRFKPERALNQLAIDLTDARVIQLNQHGNTIRYFKWISYNLSSNLLARPVIKPKISDMMFTQLREEMRGLERLDFSDPANAAASLQRMNLSLGTNASPEQTTALVQQAEKYRRKAMEEVRVTMHFEAAFSFACFAFVLVGIPLGIRVHRRETNIGIFIALLLVGIYYGFIMLGNSLSGHPELYPHLIVWIPNFIFQAIGAALLWRANRGI